MSLAKGKGKATDTSENVSRRGSLSSSSSSTSTPENLSEESDLESVSSEYLESLLAKAKAEAANRKEKDVGDQETEEVIALDDESDQTPLPPLDPGPSLPRPYFRFGGPQEGLSLIHDVDAEAIRDSAPSQPSGVPPPPELNKDGKILTKRQKKEQKNATTGPAWFDLPAPAAADLPRLHREVEALRLRNALDPKRFYRKEEGEGKGIKGLPKHFAIGTIIPSSTPFGTASADNLTKAQRKRTVVDELVDDAEAKRYAKRKFLDLQVVRGERGRGTWAKKQAARRKKW